MEFFEVDHAWGARCEASDLHRHHYPRNGIETVRCGGYVTRGVSWEGRVEGRHTLLVCDRHAARFAAQAIEGGY